MKKEEGKNQVKKAQSPPAYKRQSPRPPRENRHKDMLKALAENLIVATIQRVNHEKWYGFLRGLDEEHDTFFHANVVRFTQEALKQRGGEALARTRGMLDAFQSIQVGWKVAYLPAELTKDVKGPRARWVGVGPVGEGSSR